MRDDRQNSKQNSLSNFKKITLGESKKLQMRSELLEFVKNTNIIPSRAPKIKSPFMQFMFSTQRAFAALVIVAGVLGVIKVSEDAKIGDVLYPVKVYLADPINQLFKTEKIPNQIDTTQNNTTQTFVQPETTNDIAPSLAPKAEPALRTSGTNSAEPSKGLCMGCGGGEEGNNVNVVPVASEKISAPFTLNATSLQPSFKILYPKKYVVAKVDNDLEIKWENNLPQVDNKIQTKANISIQSVSVNPLETVRKYEIASDVLLANQGSYVWHIPKELVAGFYRIRIVSLDQKVILGTSEEFLIND